MSDVAGSHPNLNKTRITEDAFLLSVDYLKASCHATISILDSTILRSDAQNMSFFTIEIVSAAQF